MSDDKRIIVCTRIADMPGPPVMAAVKKCNECDARIWLADSTLPILEETHAPLVCIQCFEEMVAKDPNPTFMPLTDKQQAEVREWFESEYRNRVKQKNATKENR